MRLFQLFYLRFWFEMASKFAHHLFINCLRFYLTCPLFFFGQVPKGARLLFGEIDTIGNQEPLSTEKLSPILGFYRAKTFEEATKMAVDLVRMARDLYALSIKDNDENFCRSPSAVQATLQCFTPARSIAGRCAHFLIRSICMISIMTSFQWQEHRILSEVHEYCKPQPATRDPFRSVWSCFIWIKYPQIWTKLLVPSMQSAWVDWHILRTGSDPDQYPS